MNTIYGTLLIVYGTFLSWLNPAAYRAIQKFSASSLIACADSSPSSKIGSEAYIGRYYWLHGVDRLCWSPLN